MPPIQILELGNESSEASHSITTHLEDKKKKFNIQNFGKTLIHSHKAFKII